MSNSIVIINVDTDIRHVDIVKAAAALQRQVLEHLYPVWHVDATVRAADEANPARDDEWHFELRKVPTIDGALGFHDVTDNGKPRLYDFPELDAADGVPWTVTASHEILEALVDPWLRRASQDDNGVFWAAEVGDAVEADTYSIDGVMVSNFSYPEWFEPPTDRINARYDHMGLCTEPWEIRAGGYGQTWSEKDGWAQKGMQRTGRKALASLGLSRGFRRNK